jgi:heme a synthase
MTKAFILTTDKNDRAIGTWLLVMAVLVFAMVVVGGATRLTESGLSMVHWQPLSGAIPPISDAEWQAEFEAYQAFPEYQILNRGMELEEFKSIFWWEFSHRLLGRLIGLAFALPLLLFVAKRMVRLELKMTLFLLFALGAAQGLLGWYMVQSGLVDEPAVSQYRLAAHLGMALILMGALLWVGLGLLRPKQDVKSSRRPLWNMSRWFAGMVFVQCLLGALVAGLDAGMAYNTWPLMDGRLIPDGLFEFSPWYLNFGESSLTVQFDHRMVAYAVFAFGLYLFLKVRATITKEAGDGIRKAAHAVIGLLFLQILLGIATLVYQVPVGLGTLHQAGGALMLAASIFLSHQIWRTPS